MALGLELAVVALTNRDLDRRTARPVDPVHTVDEGEGTRHLLRARVRARGRVWVRVRVGIRVMVRVKVRVRLGLGSPSLRS